MYRSPRSMRFGKISFVLIRYFSIVLLITSNAGYFYHGFSAATCSAYYIVPPVLKVTQIMISQAIIGYRAWAITRRSEQLGRFLLGLGLIVTALEWFTNLYGRTPDWIGGNCRARDAQTQWAFYLIAMIFDAVTCVISTFFLVKWAGGIHSMSALTKILFYDGLGYMIALTAVNMLNLILYHRSGAETPITQAFAPLEYTVIWIMSQRILIHIHEAAGERAHQSVSLAGRISTPRDTTSAMQNQSNSFTRRGTETGSGELDVEVQIEKTATVDYSPVVLERTTGDYGLSGTRDRALPKGSRDHPENRTSGSLRI